ncbi:hypothetical protein [Nocardia mexicana]|uniref:Gfo/Idh/MocA-like oxidoreductase N-terminal domain-containing protein n=1 Tax=Nocardia mexicana TaxID=279262 RepID=A0A370HCM2_9NOCA|nr:hypothetical protein [Nocardia mexicana]RDI54678.1 hypothetical protein DFR68_102808 [Nocardia mexicana]
MRAHPTAFAWVDADVSPWGEWENARIRQLARRLGYVLYWPRPSAIPLVDQVRAADVDAVITPSPSHLDVIQLHALMCIVDVETATPRMSFARWMTFPCQVGQP